MNYLIISQAASSLKYRQIVLLIEHNNLRRINNFKLPLAADLDLYMSEHGTRLWSEGSLADDEDWIEQEERQFDSLYRAVIRAGLQAARQENASLRDVSDAMENLINNSAKSQHWQQLQAMTAASSVAQRDRFLLLCAFLFLSKTLGERMR